jgi:hypothetical protein
LEESLAIIALQRRSEIEYMKLLVVVNAIMSTGSNMVAGLSGQAASGGDGLKKALAHLEKMLLPHHQEDTDRKAHDAKRVLLDEVAKGEIKYKVVGQSKKRRRR